MRYFSCHRKWKLHTSDFLLSSIVWIIKNRSKQNIHLCKIIIFHTFRSLKLLELHMTMLVIPITPLFCYLHWFQNVLWMVCNWHHLSMASTLINLGKKIDINKLSKICVTIMSFVGFIQDQDRVVKLKNIFWYKTITKNIKKGNFILNQSAIRV